MKNSILTAILFPITITLTSLSFEKIGIIEEYFLKKEIILRKVRNNYSTMPKIYINGSGPINNEIIIIPPTSPCIK